MLKIPVISVVLCLFFAFLTLFSCSKSPDNPQPNQEQLQSLQNRLHSAQKDAKESQENTQKAISELHKTKLQSAWITGFCVSAAVLCLFTGIGIGCRTKVDALNSKSTKKGARASEKRSANKPTEEANPET